jgi:lipoprotein-releasing system permease protein
LYEGVIIAFTGAILGAFLGVSLVLAQDCFGFVGMGMATAVQTSYPVKLVYTDLLITAASITVITLIASLQPARLAMRTPVIQHI